MSQDHYHMHLGLLIYLPTIEGVGWIWLVNVFWRNHILSAEPWDVRNDVKEPGIKRQIVGIFSCGSTKPAFISDFSMLLDIQYSKLSV